MIVPNVCMQAKGVGDVEGLLQLMQPALDALRAGAHKQQVASRDTAPQLPAASTSAANAAITSPAAAAPPAAAAAVRSGTAPPTNSPARTPSRQDHHNNVGSAAAVATAPAAAHSTAAAAAVQSSNDSGATGGSTAPPPCPSPPPPFLSRFCAGEIYALIGTMAVELLEKQHRWGGLVGVVGVGGGGVGLEKQHTGGWGRWGGSAPDGVGDRAPIIIISQS